MMEFIDGITTIHFGFHERYGAHIWHEVLYSSHICSLLRPSNMRETGGELRKGNESWILCLERK